VWSHAGESAGAPKRQPCALDLQSTEKFLDGLGVLFYVAMALAALMSLMGSPGWGFLTLVLGSCALVVRTTMESIARGPRA
jgi:hypothetical protein